MRTKNHFTKVCWWSLGLLFPAGQALWANAVIRGNNTHLKIISRFPFEDTTTKWREKLCSQSQATSIIEGIYEHEAARRPVLSSKAQASLGIAALMITVFSFLTPIISSNNNLNSYFPVWGLLGVAVYMLSAIACAFHALRLERYIAVELDDLNTVMSEASRDEESDIETRIGAHRAAAVEFNRPITLTVANLVDAAFSSLRHSIVLLVAIPSATWLWKILNLHIKSIFC